MEVSSEEPCSDSYSCSYLLALKLLKEKLAKTFMKEIHKSYFSEIAKGGFTKPVRREVVTDSSTQKKDSVGGSTMDSESEKSNSEEVRWPTSSESVEEWKTNLITGLFLEFEERCFLEKHMDEEAIRVFRSMNRGLLSKILFEHGKMFRGQKYASIASCILMINASKLKLCKDKFMRVMAGMSSMQRMNLTTVSSIKRTKSFLLLKSLGSCLA